MDIELSIDGIAVQAPPGATILQAAQAAGIGVPTLCYHPALTANAICRR